MVISVEKPDTEITTGFQLIKYTTIMLITKNTPLD